MLEAQNLTKEYPTPRGPMTVLADVSFSLARGEAAAIMGPSGSGKSSLLYLIGTLEPPTSGTVTFDGSNPFLLSASRLAAFRNEMIGFVFQDHCLLPQCTVLENVLIPTFVAASDGEGGEKDSRKTMERARELVRQVGLEHRADHRPAELSGGERQRVAIARGLIRSPRVLLCDEPTGNLDRTSAEGVASLLLELHRQQNAILIVVTHSNQLAERFPIRFELVDRQLHRI